MSTTSSTAFALTVQHHIRWRPNRLARRASSGSSDKRKQQSGMRGTAGCATGFCHSDWRCHFLLRCRETEVAAAEHIIDQTFLCRQEQLEQVCACILTSAGSNQLPVEMLDARASTQLLCGQAQPKR